MKARTRALSLLSAVLVLLSLVVVPGSASGDGLPPWVPGEGRFVSYRGAIFRIVGGAAMYVSTWSIYGGRQPTQAILQTDFDWYALWPKDGTFVRTVQDGAYYRFVGGAPVYISTWAAYGGKAQPAVAIDKADLDHAGVYDFPWHGVVNAIPTDNDPDGPGGAVWDRDLFIRGAQSGRTYHVVGGSPQYVSSWAPYGGKAKPVVVVDQTAIDRAGQPGVWRFLHRYPLEGYKVVATQNHAVYVIAGGAPIYVASPAMINDVGPSESGSNSVPVPIDQANLDLAGTGPYDHVRSYPADGTVLIADPGYWRVRAGVAVYLGSRDPGTPPYVYVDPVAIQRAGTGGPFNHLKGHQGG